MARPRPVPAPRTRFVGRVEELGELLVLHERDRLVTLVGPGGCGKTRLALELARSLDGPTAWVELAAITHDDDIGTAFLDALGGRDGTLRDPLEHIVDSIHGLGASGPTEGRVLLVVDNAEHLVKQVARVVDDILAGVAGLRVVVTSREPLSITGETVYRVPAMSLARDAVDLFVDRAALVRPDLDLDGSALGTVEEICRRLDGLPLGLELAAAQLHLLSPERMLIALEDRFRLLMTGNRSALPRHRTLEASIAWSYSLLAADERHLLDRLSVFRGSFDAPAACAAASGAVAADVVEDLLGRLVTKSLVLAEPRAAGTRFRLLETIASYGARQLAERREADSALGLLADHVDGVTAPWDQVLPGGAQVRLLGSLAKDEGTIRVVLDHLAVRAAGGDGGAADRLWTLIGRLTFFWQSAGRFREARSWFSAAQEAPATDPRLELAARWGAAHLATYGGAFEAAIKGAKGTYGLADDLGDDRYAGRCLDTLASILCYLDPVAAIDTAEQAIVRAEAANDLWCATDARQVLAFTHLVRHDHSQAIETLDAAHPGALELDHPLLLAWDQIGRATVAVARGRRAEARTAIESCRAQVARTEDLNLDALLVGLEATDARLGGGGAEWVSALHDCRRRCERAEAGLSLPIVIADLLLVLVDGGDSDGAKAIVDSDVDMVVALAPAFAPRLQGIATAAALLAGNAAEAVRRAGRTREAADALANPNDRAITAPVLALALLEEGDAGAAEAEAATAVDRLSRLDLRPTLIDAVEVLGLAVAARGDRATARWLAAVSARERDRLGLVRTELQQLTAGRLADALGALRSSEPRDGAGIPGADQAGRSADATIEEVIAYLGRSRGARRRPSIGWSSLTPTELQVVEAVAGGCTNAQAAEQLFISPSTVKTHLAHIYQKLGVANRTALVAARAAAASTDPR